MRKAAELVRALLAIPLLAAGAAGCGIVGPSDAMPACQPNSGHACSSQDGYPVGRYVQHCGPTGQACGELGTLTRRAIDAKMPDHAAVLAADEYDLDLHRVCDPGVLCTFSSTHAVVIFDFADGTHRAVGYECAGVSPCRATFAFMDYEGGFEGP